jgi:hypothetical protein
MQWTADNTPPSIQGKSLKLRELFAKAANASLAKGFSEEESVFAGTNAVKIEERKNQPARVKTPKKPSHVESLRSYTNPFEVVAKAEDALPSTLKTAEFDPDGHLILSMSDGRKIKTKNKAVEQNIEQNIAIAPNVQILSTDNSITIDQTTQIFDIGTGSVINPLDHLDFNLATSSIGAVGRLRWNDADGTLEFGLKGGNVTLQVGQEEVIHILNNTENAFTDLQVIQITGASGLRMTGALAQANGESTSAATFAVVTEPILKNQIGFATVSGLVRNVNTSAFPEGSALYLSPTVPGGITSIKPVAPNHLVSIGWCVRSHHINGSIYVNVQNGYELEELHNVSITSALNDQVLAYDSATSLWKNKSISSSSGTVTSVGLSLPVGLTVSGSPVTTSGVLAVSLQSGYSIPTTQSQTQWDNATKTGTYFNRINTVANTPYIITHNLSLVDKDAFTINLMLNSESILPAVVSIDANSIGITTSVNTVNLAVMIVGIKT